MRHKSENLMGHRKTSKFFYSKNTELTVPVREGDIYYNGGYLPVDTRNSSRR